MSVPRRFALFGLAALSLGAPDLATACRIYRQPAERVRRRFDAIVVVKVTGSERTGRSHEDFNPWRARAELLGVISGQPGTSSFAFEGVQSSAACDHRQPPKAPGERWVLYLLRSSKGMEVREAYPLSMMERDDPRVANWTVRRRQD